jgi:hypothetical protein
VPQRFFTKSPKTINRVKLSDNRDRNRVNSEIQSGYQKPPFLADRLRSSSRRDRGSAATRPEGTQSKKIQMRLKAVYRRR